MFTLEDGREQLYQWDLNRRILVTDSKICEVHFCNRTSDCSLVVETYTDDTYDGKVYADIPNILLQDARPIRAYAYCDDQYTLTEQQFTVKARTKPADYVYTETELLQYSTLDERIKAIETGITDTVATEVNKYMEDNPITVDLSNYYTRGETDVAIEEAIEDIRIPETDISGKADLVHQHSMADITDYVAPDLSEYAKKTDIPVIPDIPSLDGYATEQYVDDAIANIDIPESTGDGVKAVFIDASAVSGTSSAIPDEYLPVFQNYASGEDRNYLFNVKLDSSTYYQPTSIYCPEEQILALDFGMTKNNDNEIYYKSLIVRPDTSVWYINTHSTAFASKYYVDNLFANIATAEGGSY